jgi:5-formyltetrahydrofolate cyclo-ligase
MRRRHDADAGGPAGLLAAKAELRTEIWAALRAAKATRFPGPEGRIPNFVGAEAAAERLRGTDAWRAAGTVKANPDSPQWPVRQRALEDGKLLYMAVPRLAEAQPFFLLDPEELAGSARAASSIKGATASARPVDVDELKPVDLVVAGTVAAGLDGARLGKGGGFSDLEFAVASEAGLIGPETVVVTTVHEVQVLPPGEIPTTDHDVALDLIVTPDRVIECSRRGRRPVAAIRWDELTDEKVEAIPLLARLRAARRP